MRKKRMSSAHTYLIFTLSTLLCLKSHLYQALIEWVVKIIFMCPTLAQNPIRLEFLAVFLRCEADKY